MHFNRSGFRYAFLPHVYVSLQVSTITTSRVSYKFLDKVTQMLHVRFLHMTFTVFLFKIRKSKCLLVGCPSTFGLDLFSSSYRVRPSDVNVENNADPTLNCCKSYITFITSYSYRVTANRFNLQWK